MIWWKWLLISQLLFGGVYSYSSSYGYDPLSAYSMDIIHYSYTGYVEAESFRNYFDENYSTDSLDKGHLLVLKADSLLYKIECTYKFLANKNYFGKFPYNYYLFNEKKQDPDKDELRNLLNVPKVKVKIIPEDEPIVFSLPNGCIYISRSMIDGGRYFSIKSDTQYAALLIHEYIHIQHKHLLYRWGIAGAINEYIKKKRSYDWTKWLSILPIAYSHSVYSTRDLSYIPLIDFHLECLADFYTAIILQDMGYDIKEYIGILTELKRYNDSMKKNKKRKIESEVLRYRIELLKTLTRPDAGEYEYIIVKKVDNGKLYAYKFKDNPLLVKYAVYWSWAFKLMGAPVEEIAYDAHEDGDIDKPIRSYKAIVFPDKLIELPIFSFIN